MGLALQKCFGDGSRAFPSKIPASLRSVSPTAACLADSFTMLHSERLPGALAAEQLMKLILRAERVGTKSASRASRSSVPPQELRRQFYIFCFSILKPFFKKQLCDCEKTSTLQSRHRVAWGSPHDRGRSLGRCPRSPSVAFEFLPPRACPWGTSSCLTSEFMIVGHTGYSG